jgi:hypothetical protein
VSSRARFSTRATRALRRVVQRAPAAFAPLGLAVIGPDADGYDLARPEALELTRRARVILTSGWVFSGHFFLAKHAQAVRSFFRPLPRIRENVNTIVARARARSDILVGIHIRHGDYRLYRNGRYFYPTAAYATLMHRARGLFGELVGFLVCSDEPQDRSRFDGLEVSFGSGHLVEDMYALAGCDYILGPPSTFSWWASFYGGVRICWILDPDQDLRVDAFSAPIRLVRQPGGAPIADGPNAEPLSSGGPFAL